MKKKLNLPVCLFILALILCIGSVHYSAASVQAATVTKKQIGFVKKNGNWYYYDKNGKKATGWYQSASGNKYYFGKTGAAKAGILTISGKKYCFNSKGKMLTTWQTINGKTYFINEKKGYMYTGWITTPKFKPEDYVLLQNAAQTVNLSVTEYAMNILMESVQSSSTETVSEKTTGPLTTFRQTVLWQKAG